MKLLVMLLFLSPSLFAAGEGEYEENESAVVECMEKASVDLGSMMESLMNEGYRCYSWKGNSGILFDCWGLSGAELPSKYITIRDKCTDTEESGNDTGTDDANAGADNNS